MQISQDFFLKNRLVVMRLARDLLSTDLDERLHTVDEYTEELKVSRGTVQKALQLLVDEKCITTYFRGHLGNYLIAKDDDKLWEYSGFGTLSGAMPIPLGELAQGIATGVCDCMKAQKVPFNCVFIQGGNTRLKGLLQHKYDFIIASYLTAQLVKESYPDLEEVMELPGCIYGGKYILYFADPEKTQVEDGMRVAIDPSSIDQHILTELVCENRKNIQYIETTYFDTHYCVKDGRADVTVSRSDTLASVYLDKQNQAHAEERDAHSKELPVLKGYTRKDMELFNTTVVLASKDNYGMANLLRRTMRPAVISYAQKQIINGSRIPSYY